MNASTSILALMGALAVFAAATDADESQGQFTGDIKPLIYVTDVEKSAPFYRDVLGFGLDGFAGDEADPYYAAMLAGPRKFGLHEPTMPEDKSRVGQQRVYFRVRDIKAQRDFVEAHGYRVDEIFQRDWMDYFLTSDPDGNVIVFAETDPARHSSQPWTK